MPPRPRYQRPDLIRETLDERRLMHAYQARPAYRQNEYIGGVIHARLGSEMPACRPQLRIHPSFYFL